MSNIQRIKDSLDIVEVVERYVPLTRAGNDFKACCPFHQEKTPSFYVSPTRQTWHCFGACGEGGDVFSFVMKQERLDFGAALRRLAAEAGMELASAKPSAAARRFDPLYDAMAQAVAFYRRQFQENPEAHKARAYVEQRGISPAMAERFGLGYSPWGPAALQRGLQPQGELLERLAELHLVFPDEQSGAYRDRFRGRLMLPIRDAQGKPIGFGARTLAEGTTRGPKYLNSSASPLFQKNRVLYGIDQAAAAIRKKGQAVLVEGYLDVIAAHQHGYDHTVACLGTAVTPEQLQTLRRYAANIVFALDADAAGQQATLRGLARARQALRAERRGAKERQQTLHLSIATLPPGQDPDDLIRAQPQAWDKLVDAAASLVHFYADHVTRNFDLRQPEAKQAAMEMLAEVLADLDQLAAQEAYVQQMSDRFRIAPGILRQMMREARPGPRRARPRPEAGPDSAADAAQVRETWREDHLIGLLLLAPAVILERLEPVLKHFAVAPIQASDFDRTENRALFQAVQQALSADAAWNPDRFQQALEAPLQSHAEQLRVAVQPFQSHTSHEKSQVALQNLLLMRRKAVSRTLRMFSLQEEPADAESIGQQNRVRQTCYQTRQRLDLALDKFNARHHV